VPGVYVSLLVLSAAHFDQAIKLARTKSEPKKAAEFVVTQNPEDRQLPSPPLPPLFLYLPSVSGAQLAICSGYRGVGMAGMLAVAPFLNNQV